MERIRQNVHESSREDDSGSEGFDDKKGRFIGLKSGNGTSKERKENADNATDEDCEDSYEFELQRFGFIGTSVIGIGFAS